MVASFETTEQANEAGSSEDWKGRQGDGDVDKESANPCHRNASGDTGGATDADVLTPRVFSYE